MELENSKLDVLFITGILPDTKIKEIIELSKGNVQFAANNLQWRMIDGLIDNGINKITIVSAMFLGEFPFNYRKIFINEYKMVYRGVEIVFVPFVNIFGLSKFSKYFSILKYVKNWVNNGDTENKIVLNYSLTLPFVLLSKFFSKFNIPFGIYVPDLPQYMNLTTNFLYRTLKGLEIRLMDNFECYIDYYVLITEAMKQKIGIGKPTYIFEGIAPEPLESNIEYNPSREIIFLYSGGLLEEYGVKQLIDDFRGIERDDIQLWVFGSGILEEYIIDLSKIDKRIKFMGVKSNLEVRMAQTRATYLINPRPNNQDFSIFSFPSKTLEYMVSGTPMIGYKLSGIPSEYYPYMLMIEDGDTGLRVAIENAINLDTEIAAKLGEDAKEFVLNHKNQKIQMAKLINFLTYVKNRGSK